MANKKREILIEVERSIDRKVPVWWITITEAPNSAYPVGRMLPGDFKRKLANKAAQTLAISYAESGYYVTLTTLEKHGPYLRYFNRRDRSQISQKNPVSGD